MLQLDQVSRAFGALRAVDGVSLVVRPGERRAIIGPNGAGKTTLFNVISGELPASAGRIRLAGRDITRLSAHRRAAAGLGRTYQITNLFPRLTVAENLLLAVRGLGARKFSLFGAARPRPKEAQAVERALRESGMAARRRTPASLLSYGEQRELELAVALATTPRLLLLDEPAAGMNPKETGELDALITRIRDEDGVSILIIEHDMKLVMSISDRIYVLDYGRLIAQGTPREVASNPNVIKAYLGEAFDA